MNCPQKQMAHSKQLVWLLVMVGMGSVAHAAVAGPLKTCNKVADKANTAFYGHCPCSCQLASNQEFSCSSCPITCSRWMFICKPPTACRDTPPAVPGVAWRASCKNVAAGAKCFGSCKRGFTGGGAVSACTAGGWKQLAVDCTPMSKLAPAAAATKATACSGMPGTVPNAQEWAGTCRNTKVGGWCNAPCKAGYTGKAFAKCKKTGVWTAPVDECMLVAQPEAVTACKGLPTGAANAQSWPVACDTMKVGSWCNAPCKAGFAGKAFAKCKKTGEWTAPMDECKPVPQPAGAQPATAPTACEGRPAAATKAEAWPDKCDTMTVGGWCSAPCKPGFTGKAFAQCKATGMWTPPVDECKPVAQPAITPVMAAPPQTKSKLRHAEQPVKCKGEPPAVPNATWQGCDGLFAGQVCIANCTTFGTAGGFKSYCRKNGKWGKVRGFGCSEVTCSGSPKSVEGATWPDCTGFRIGEMCTVSYCNKGYKGMGYISNCMADGRWDDIWGDCRKEGAPPAVVMESGEKKNH